MTNDAVLIVGGGLAGLVAAIHLKNHNQEVIIIEKNEFPKHKVCGEYISNEVVPYLESLGLDIESLKPTHIEKLSFSLVSGKSINTQLPLGGFGISRYELDQYLYTEATKRGCSIVQETVADINFVKDYFTITTNLNTYKTAIVLGAFGKRSNLDVKLGRSFIQKQSNWLGVKAHYKLNFPDDLVGLHHFKGGYCGVSKIENNLVNICYLANYETFKQYKSIREYENKVASQNPHLKQIFDEAILQFEKPLTISQVSFEEKKCVEDHILMIGDTAGLIHPLCGNGMAMAIHSAKIAAELVISYSSGEIKTREVFEKKYSEQWNYNFKKRLQIGRLLGRILQKEKLAAMLMRILIVFPFLLPIIIKKTHGKAIL
ncbi:NAD(P)/FAD-dependent oxidoreductase [Flavobacterium sp. F-380]|uniref:NAD(P)/FAD-dependent oxidoreductase n=1 Tax=Flavobacterium kayseriense TaxID=2764714 RepID=A0ABR7J8H9_9FLAO|nr:NAD(P)/FAD-dependent oxidoreductase [Flavobacterium kayseriense]MBC5841860.1 NAD(P)/FAD-dependent oxidoreductase [Flavobacterium kayseriense]MBC5848389.1 NAD(P)/FAD-dependent oxidoreductase [Flavobacterium kayseriense]